MAPHTGDGTPQWLAIVGVAPTIRRFALPDTIEPLAYTPWSLAPPSNASLLLAK
jgi:hypothetical protein